MLERLGDYGRKLRLLRQIMSNKAKWYAAMNTTANLATVVVASFLTFMGFSGIPTLHRYLSVFLTIEQSTVELVFNLLIFSVLVLVIAHLVFRFGAKQSDAERAVVMLTHLINRIDDTFAKAEHGYVVSLPDVDLIREKYDSLLQVIPPNSDREYLRAKKDYREKEERKTALHLGAREIFDSSAQHRTVEALIRQSPALMEILDSLRRVDYRLFLGGGLIRNTVWDHLHGYSSPAPIDDVDVIYYDRLSATKEHDRDLEGRLRVVLPNLKWSVKNQARMHQPNDDSPYASLEDAVAKWPETATAILARLRGDGDIEILAPYGFDDLFRLIVAPTEHFRAKMDRYRQRVEVKQWGAHWPRLRFFDVSMDVALGNDAPQPADRTPGERPPSGVP